MKKTDIAKEPLYIKELIFVFQGAMRKREKIRVVDARPNDAFVFFLSGDAVYCFDDGNTCPVTTGDVLYLPQFSNYTINVQSEELRYIFCNFKFFSDSLRLGAAYTPANPTEVKNMFVRLLSNYRTSERGALQNCMSILYRIYGAILYTNPQKKTVSHTAQKIIEAREYMEHNYTDPNISISRLAEAAGMSEVYFRQRFKAMYNCAPSKYITALRIEHSKRLMDYSFLTLEQCAEQSGFLTAQYFGRVFKAYTGMTPAKYRKQL